MCTQDREQTVARCVHLQENNSLNNCSQDIMSDEGAEHDSSSDGACSELSESEESDVPDESSQDAFSSSVSRDGRTCFANVQTYFFRQQSVHERVEYRLSLTCLHQFRSTDAKATLLVCRAETYSRERQLWCKEAVISEYSQSSANSLQRLTQLH